MSTFIFTMLLALAINLGLPLPHGAEIAESRTSKPSAR